ncbi:MAG: hypothetical protein LBG97_10045 [Coriobacteriales bacterium]|jgi:hypothetical protein|nr:hypothetical protein [Coriobacteriales bacterium]
MIDGIYKCKTDALESESRTAFDTPLGVLRIQANGKAVPFLIQKLPAVLKKMGKPEMLFQTDERYRVIPDLDGIVGKNEFFTLTVKCEIALDQAGDIGDGFEFGLRNATLVLFEGKTVLALGGWDFEDEPEQLMHQMDMPRLRCKDKRELPCGMQIEVRHRDCMRYAEFYIAWITLRKDYEGSGCALDDTLVRDLWDAVNTDLYGCDGGYWLTGKDSARDVK